MNECQCGGMARHGNRHGQDSCEDIPITYGPLKTFHGHATITGPCGDTMMFWIYLENQVIREISFFTDGCHVSHACGGLATILAKGRTMAEAILLTPQMILECMVNVPPESEHCATLAITTLKATCEDAQNNLANPTDGLGVDSCSK